MTIIKTPNRVEDYESMFTQADFCCRGKLVEVVNDARKILKRVKGISSIDAVKEALRKSKVENPETDLIPIVEWIVLSDIDV